ncbi:MAG TPA: hypothetical protein VFI74_05145 [Candidatus Saccharimonadales bacterium]|nr:hypothetical protein [Candidatus Saccharimonadales bacterium]
MQIRSGEKRAFDYPVSEEVFAEWQQTTLDSNPGSMVVKLAFENLAFGDDNPVQHAAQEDDFATAQKLFFEQEAITNTYASQIRPYTDAGHRFVRFHAVRLGELGQRHSPSVYGGYWRRLSLHFAHLNGPLGGETTYAVPPDIATDAKLYSMPHEQEAHVILTGDKRVAGVATVTYNQDRTAIAERTFLNPERVTAICTGLVAKKLLSVAALQKYRVPQFEPPQAVQEKLGITPVETAGFAPAPQGFNDLLPAAFRW